MQKRPQLFILPILALAFAAISGGLRPAVLGTLKDPRDGKTYKTTMIGKKEWMAQNLNYQMEGSFAINNNETFSEKMGRLYTWKAVESKNLCPKGWHVPTSKEWQEALRIPQPQSFTKRRFRFLKKLNLQTKVHLQGFTTILPANQSSNTQTIWECFGQAPLLLKLWAEIRLLLSPSTMKSMKGKKV
jgi:uncharacterized protein (TIGR02145 family)